MGPNGDANFEAGSRVIATDGDRPAVGLDYLLGDGETETRAAGISGPSVVQPDESSEDPVPLVGWYARTVVGDDQDCLIIPPGQGDGDTAAGVARRVGDHVRHGSAKFVGVALQLDRRDAADIDRHGRGDLLTGGLVANYFVQVDRRPTLGERALVGSGQSQQVIHEVLDPLELRLDSVCGLLPVRRLGMRTIDLELRQGRRQGAAQFMGRVGYETPLPGLRLLETLEHVVHGASQSSNFVSPAGVGYPTV
jgi:hypothetical protein